MGKKFMGLDGTGHFWDRAKAWILDQIKSVAIDKQSVIDAVYPVGSLYWSSQDTDPSTLFGGTWVQIKDRFVLACGDTYKTVGATGGASTVTLSVSNMPSHSHSLNITTTGMSSHSTGWFEGFKPDGGLNSSSFPAYADGSTFTRSTGNNNTAVRNNSTNNNTRVNMNIAHTHKVSGNTSSNGSGTAFNILPPYVVKYCWERTA